MMDGTVKCHLCGGIIEDPTGPTLFYISLSSWSGQEVGPGLAMTRLVWAPIQICWVCQMRALAQLWLLLALSLQSSILCLPAILIQHFLSPLLNLNQIKEDYTV
jgi:hypothetical protein